MTIRCLVSCVVAALLSSLAGGGVTPDGTSFTYQARLAESGSPVVGFVDLRFRLYDQATGGVQVASQVFRTGVLVEDGVFAVGLDFGPAFTGAERWLEVAVRLTFVGGTYTTLSPRQLVTPAPTAQFSMLSGGVDWSGVTGKPAGFADDTDDGAFSLNMSNEAYFTGGNVGIGTSNPNDLLEVVGTEGGSFRVRDIAANVDTGNQLISQWVSEVGGVTLRLIGVDGMGGQIGSTVALEQSGALSFGNHFPRQVNIDFEGRVGIGTEVPGAELDVVGTGRIQLPVNSDTPDGSQILLTTPGGSPGLMLRRGDGMGGLGNQWVLYDQASTLRLGHNTAGVSDRRLMVDQLGQISVGVLSSAQTARLEVVQPPSASGNVISIRGTTTLSNGQGVRGDATASSGANYGVYGHSASASGWGVYANGRLGSSGTKSFCIDHPLAPEEKFLLHYSMEGPEPLNIYSGTVVLDGQGQAVVELPEYFESINADCHYQLTAIGAPALLYVAEKVQGNHFRIAGGAPGMEVCWEVKAKRMDRFVQRAGAPVEVEKGPEERGLYLQPELYDQPAEKGLGYMAPETVSSTK
ncbi:MAG: hypothetical protein KDA21_07920 [Phycisphaerales bacterium]|nr:hypothetical protein [Phycisphaerales bacterium]